VTDVTMIVNGQTRRASVPPETTLLQLLRDYFYLTGAKLACDVGDCGACTAIVDGKPVNGCLMLVGQADGCHVITIEGLTTRDQLHPIQKAFEKTERSNAGSAGQASYFRLKRCLMNRRTQRRRTSAMHWWKICADARAIPRWLRPFRMPHESCAMKTLRNFVNLN
jgi:aerobic-type carbon monoxide dehydrogenase small subunit (CoxS/CutS family)